VGFYIRKAFSFGPLRLNLSRSGLGASFGVTGARIGIKPSGSTYIQAGRGGLYYRQTLTPASTRHYNPVPPTPNPAVDNELQEITSTDATNLVDSSAGELLQELNRVKRRHDLLAIVIVVGFLLLCRMMLLEVDLWVYPIGLSSIAVLALCTRHYDVTNGSVILNYSQVGDASQRFAELEAAFKGLASCAGLWHVDASGNTDDWKRNAGVGSLVNRSAAELQFACPPKVSCNIAVPKLTARKKFLYFFPDRLLIYDASGVGTVPYSELKTETAQTRFAEDGVVPKDATQVGTRWHYVNRDGSPDRRFNNNRQYPLMLYGELSFRSPAGLNELFQCSVPALGVQAASAVTSFGNDHGISTTSSGITFATPPRDSRLIGFFIWVAVIFMVIALCFPVKGSWPTAVDQEAQANLQRVRENQARQQFAQTLAQRIKTKFPNLTIDALSDELDFRFSNKGATSARRDGLEPFVKQQFFKKFVEPNTENELCGLGFRGLTATRNNKLAFRYLLICSAR